MGKSVKKVAVTGGAGQIAYSALFRIAAGEMLGKDQPIELSILEVPQAEEALRGVVMELSDCAYPLLKGVHPTTDAREAFDGIDLALLIGATPRGPGMERKDLLKENAKIFIEQGKALSEGASKETKIFVVGNPCNTNALIAAKNAPNLDPRQFFSMTRLDENRAKGLLATRAKVDVSEVKKMAVWGNHSSTMVPDFVHATIGGKSAVEVIGDQKWLETEFVQAVQQRGASIIKARGKSSAASAANAAIDSIRSMLEPTEGDDWYSLSVYSEGNPYGIDGDLFFSFPCRTTSSGKIEIVEGVEWDEKLHEKIGITEAELAEERSAILG